jgi:hypothetical protein
MILLLLKESSYMLWFVAAGSSLVTILAGILFFAFRSRLVVRISKTGSRAPDGHDIAQRVASLESQYGDLADQLAGFQASASGQLRGVVEILAGRALSSAADAQALRELVAVYAQAAAGMEPFLISVQQLRPTVALLNEFAKKPGVSAALDEFEDLAGIGERLAARQAEILRYLNGGTMQAQQAAEECKAGQRPPHEYLRTVYESSLDSSVSPAEEQNQIAELAGSTEERFLAWMDMVSELREATAVESPFGLHDACSHLIAHAGQVIEAWDIFLIDVPVGTTQFDSRLHDLGGTIPCAQVAAETVIGVRKLGHRRNGVLVRKPQVMVAAGSR